MLSPPGEAKANLLADLFRLDATLTVSLEWKRWGLDSARRKIRSAQRHYFSKRYSMAAHMQETQGTAAAMTDTAAEAESSRLGSALVELEADGVSYGSITCTVTLHGDYEQIDHLDAEVRRIFNTYDAKVIREGYGQLPAWFCRLPGQPPGRNVRSVFASAGLCSCLAPIFGSSGGRPISKHLQAAGLGCAWKPGARPPTITTFSPATWATPSFSARPVQARASASTSCWSPPFSTSLAS